MSQRLRGWALGSSSGAGLAQPFVIDFVVDDATRERLVSDVIHELEQKFVFPERVAKKLPSLIGHWSSPPFSALTPSHRYGRSG